MAIFRKLPLQAVAIFLFSTLLSGQTPAPTTATSATVSGFIKESNNTPAPGVFVLASRISSPIATFRATTKADGSFQLAAVKPGAYRLCIQSAAQIYLDPCEWSRRPTEFVVKQSATALNAGIIVVSRAISVTIHLDDPTQALQPATSASSAVSLPHVMLGIVSPGGVFRPAVITAKTATTRDHSIAIPADTPVNLMVTPHLVALNDSTGKPIAATGATVPLLHASTNLQPEPTIVFTVAKQAN